jgi:hypothetical protein
LEDIELKLKKAESIRREEFAKKFAANTDEKLTKVLERKETLEREQANKLIKEMETKLETAEQLRTQAIESKIVKARKESEKIPKVLETKLSLEKQRENRTFEKLEKTEITSQKKEALQKMTVEKAKSHVQKVMQTVEQHKQNIATKTEIQRSQLEMKHQRADSNRE